MASAATIGYGGSINNVAYNGENGGANRRKSAAIINSGVMKIWRKRRRIRMCENVIESGVNIMAQ